MVNILLLYKSGGEYEKTWRGDVRIKIYPMESRSIVEEITKTKLLGAHCLKKIRIKTELETKMLGERIMRYNERPRP